MIDDKMLWFGLSLFFVFLVVGLSSAAYIRGKTEKTLLAMSIIGTCIIMLTLIIFLFLLGVIK